MNAKKVALLKKKGYRVGDAGDFLQLSKEERAYIEMKAMLASALSEWRAKKHMTQEQMAKLLHSSQSRVAKMEKNDASVSMDLLIRSLMAMGATRNNVSEIIRQ